MQFGKKNCITMVIYNFEVDFLKRCYNRSHKCSNSLALDKCAFDCDNYITCFKSVIILTLYLKDYEPDSF